MPESAETHTYIFPEMTEAELRQARLQSFWSSAIVALLPILVHLAWDVSDILHWVWGRFLNDTGNLNSESLTLWVPDIALAGVIVAISAFFNTLFSFVKLRAESHAIRYRKGTYILGVCVTVFSIFCFVQYLRTTHISLQHAVDPIMLFLSAFFFALATFVSALSLQYTFVADELHCARKAVRRLDLTGGA